MSAITLSTEDSGASLSPIANLAVRTHHEAGIAWQPGELRAKRTRHQIVAGGGWKMSRPRNRFSTPSDTNLITANGAPAFVMEFNTPVDSRELVRSFSSYFADHLVLMPSLSLDIGVLGDFSRGGLPVQSSPAGSFVGARRFAAAPDLIIWNSLSPRSGFAWRVPHSHGLLLRGAYCRLYAPLAGRYLDFRNPNSLDLPDDFEDLAGDLEWLLDDAKEWMNGHGFRWTYTGGPIEDAAIRFQTK